LQKLLKRKGGLTKGSHHPDLPTIASSHSFDDSLKSGGSGRHSSTRRRVSKSPSSRGKAQSEPGGSGVPRNAKLAAKLSFLMRVYDDYDDF
jgi:hypothetical protein